VKSWGSNLYLSLEYPGVVAISDKFGKEASKPLAPTHTTTPEIPRRIHSVLFSACPALFHAVHFVL
jgi:hypothetical protein